jgi:hypothetical protein
MNEQLKYLRTWKDPRSGVSAKARNKEVAHRVIAGHLRPLGKQIPLLNELVEVK